MNIRNIAFLVCIAWVVGCSADAEDLDEATPIRLGVLYEHQDAHLDPEVKRRLSKPDRDQLPCLELEYLGSDDPGDFAQKEPLVSDLTWKDGQLAEISNDAGSTRFDYDNQGNVIRQEYLSGSGSSETFFTEYDYDEFGRLTRVEDEAFVYRYDYSTEGMRIATFENEEGTRTFRDPIVLDQRGRIVRVTEDREDERTVINHTYAGDRRVLTQVESDSGFRTSEAIHYYNGIEVARQLSIFEGSFEGYSIKTREFEGCSDEPNNVESSNNEDPPNNVESNEPSWFTGRYSGPCRTEHYDSAIFGQSVESIVELGGPDQQMFFTWAPNEPLGDELVRVRHQSSQGLFVTHPNLRSISWKPIKSEPPTRGFDHTWENGRLVSRSHHQSSLREGFVYTDGDDRPDGWSATIDGTVVATGEIFYEPLEDGGWGMLEVINQNSDPSRNSKRAEEYDAMGRMVTFALFDERDSAYWTDHATYDSRGFLQEVARNFHDIRSTRVFTNDEHGNPLYSWSDSKYLHVYRYDCYDYGNPPW